MTEQLVGSTAAGWYLLPRKDDKGEVILDTVRI